MTERSRRGRWRRRCRSFPDKRGNPHGWVAPWQLGLNEGPIVLMIENHASELLWNLIRRSPWIVTGLRRAEFRGGWLDRAPRPTALPSQG